MSLRIAVVGVVTWWEASRQDSSSMPGVELVAVVSARAEIAMARHQSAAS
jgi:hypothetical protein